MKQKIRNAAGNKDAKDRKMTHLVLPLVLIAVILLAAVVIAGWDKDRAPRYSFDVSATGLSDGNGSTIDFQGSGKFSPMAGGGLGPYFFFWNVWIQGSGTIVFVGDKKETASWHAEEATYSFSEVNPILDMKVKITGKPSINPNSLVSVILDQGDEPASGIITVRTANATYTGTGTITITAKQ